METTISRNDAISIMGVVTNLFFMRSTEHDDFVTDVGSWSIKVTTTDGMQHSFSGSMGIKPYHQLTKQIQKLVPISNLEVIG